MRAMQLYFHVDQVIHFSDREPVMVVMTSRHRYGVDVPGVINLFVTLPHTFEVGQVYPIRFQPEEP